MADPDPNPAKPAVAGPETFTREYVHELREENKSWRQKAGEAETAAQAAKDAAKAAETAATTRIGEATSAADKRVIRAELKAAALKAGMIDLDGLQLADLSAVKLNDKGEVEGGEDAITALKKAKPYMFGAPSTSSGDPAPKPNPPATKKAMDQTQSEYDASKRAFLAR